MRVSLDSVSGFSFAMFLIALIAAGALTARLIVVAAIDASLEVQCHRKGGVYVRSQKECLYPPSYGLQRQNLKLHFRSALWKNRPMLTL